MINTVTIIGNLVRDAELRFTNNGRQVVNFDIAYNHANEEVSYFEVTLWGDYAEKMHTYLSKGKQVAVQGELRQSRWEQDGQGRSKIGITARVIQLLGGQGQQRTPTAKTVAPENFTDDVPF